jgi:hypothetical protein
MPFTAEQQRERYYANLDENRRKHREYARKNRDKYNAARRELRKRDGDRIREYERERGRLRDAAARYRDKHGRWVDEDKAAMWDSQDGRCYLCGDEMDPDVIDIDHDYACCRRGRSCRVCRRGLAHHRCNVIIGWALDDPVRLRRIADNLGAAQQAFRRRRDAGGQQLPLSDLGS